MKLWEKGFSVDAAIERFTVGKDRELDILLAPFDILGSMAHAIMLESAGLLGQEELSSLLHALRELYDFASGPDFVIGEGVEDIH